MTTGINYRSRTVTPEISTQGHRYGNRKIYEARFTRRVAYDHPDRAPTCARVRHHGGTWWGDIEVQEFAALEVDALMKLQDTLRELGFEEQTALNTLVAQLQDEARPVLKQAVLHNDGLNARQRAARARIAARKAAGLPAFGGGEVPADKAGE